MKLLPTLLILATTTLPPTTATQCNIAQHPGVINAIDRFCTHKTLTVPSPYAQAGQKSTFPWPWASVAIRGSCVPPQWVPYQYCRSQFLDMCGGEATQRTYGSNGCQVWRIDYGKDQREVHLKG